MGQETERADGWVRWESEWVCRGLKERGGGEISRESA